MSNLPAIVLLLVALPFSIIAGLSDLKYMKIYNKTNIGLFLGFVVVGPFLFPVDEYGLRLSQGAVMMAAGMILTGFGMMGGGDSKFIAAMAPYIAFQNALGFLFLLSVLSLVTVALHRGVGAIKPLRPHLREWRSWSAEKRKFPFGVTLGSTLVIYLALRAF